MLALSSLDLCKSISKTLSGVIKENLFSEVPPKQPFTLTAFMLAVKILVLKTSLYFKQWKIVFAFGINGPLETSNPSQSIRGQHRLDHSSKLNELSIFRKVIEASNFPPMWLFTGNWILTFCKFFCGVQSFNWILHEW